MFLIISDLLKFAYTILMNHSRRIIERMEEMDKQKKPKYKIGDTVVITMYGTVGKVTDVKYLSGVYVYEINNSEGLYMESSLQLISEYEGELDEKEQIDIEYMYFLGILSMSQGTEQTYLRSSASGQKFGVTRTMPGKM